MKVQPVGLDECEQWGYDGAKISHQSGRFFSVVAARRDGKERLLIDQPEKGILGIVIGTNNGVANLLLQHKAEPGNDPLDQLSPTVQATKSNYERVHGGAPTAYLEYFTGELMASDFDIPHSEQGSKFIQKFNRNLMTTVGDCATVELLDGYEWVPASLVRARLGQDNIMNTDTRSVIVSGDWSRLVEDGRNPFDSEACPEAFRTPLTASYATVRDESISRASDFLEAAQAAAASPIEVIPIHQSEALRMHDRGIDSAAGAPLLAYFQIEIPGREVGSWNQPLVRQRNVVHVGLAMRVREGIAEFQLTGQPEIGFIDRVELSPSFHEKDATAYASRLEAAFGQGSKALIDVRQTDEGGRFYQCVTNYEIRFVEESPKTTESAVWLTAGELQHLCLQTGQVSHETRMLISVLLAWI